MRTSSTHYDKFILSQELSLYLGSTCVPTWWHGKQTYPGSGSGSHMTVCVQGGMRKGGKREEGDSELKLRRSWVSVLKIYSGNRPKYTSCRCLFRQAFNAAVHRSKFNIVIIKDAAPWTRVFQTYPVQLTGLKEFLWPLWFNLIPRSTDSSLNWIFTGFAQARTKHQKSGSVMIYINSGLHLLGIASASSKKIVLVVMRWEERPGRNNCWLNRLFVSKCYDEQQCFDSGFCAFPDSLNPCSRFNRYIGIISFN